MTTIQLASTGKLLPNLVPRPDLFLIYWFAISYAWSAYALPPGAEFEMGDYAITLVMTFIARRLAP